MEYIEIIVATIFVNNILLAQFLGNCPFLGTSKKMETAAWAWPWRSSSCWSWPGVITWVIYELAVGAHTNWNFCGPSPFILVIASLVQFVEMFLKKSIPALYAGLGIFLPLITTNCAVFGVCVLNIDKEARFFAGTGHILRICRRFRPGADSFSPDVRERILLARVPKPLQDTSIALITAGVITLSFYAFRGMV